MQLWACPLKQCVFTEVKNSAYSWLWGVKSRDQGPRLAPCYLCAFPAQPHLSPLDLTPSPCGLQVTMG